MKKGTDYIGVGVGAVIIKDVDKVLLLKRLKEPEKGFWTIPGGSVEFGETIEDAILREVEEELGVKVEIVQLLGVTNHIIPNEQKHWVSPSFYVRIISNNPVNKEPLVHEEIKWHSVNNLPINSTLTTSIAVNNYLKYINKNA